MEANELTIRAARPGDAAALLAIYAPYVEQTAITFEYEVPSVEDFAGRIRHVLTRYPYLLAEREGEILGYAYAGSFHDRAAYDWAVETSIYVSRERRRGGIGGRLHRALELALKEQGILNMNACIACPQQEDEYLTRNSIDFHAHLGYRLVGEFNRCGFKFDRWYNMAWMERLIGEHRAGQPAPRRFDEVRETLRERYSIL